MARVVISGAVCAALALAACASIGSLGTTPAKSLDAAYALADGAELTVETAVKTSVLKGGDALTAQSYLRTAHTALQAASDAKTLGDGSTVQAKIAAAEDLILKANALVRSK